MYITNVCTSTKSSPQHRNLRNCCAMLVQNSAPPRSQADAQPPTKPMGFVPRLQLNEAAGWEVVKADVVEICLKNWGEFGPSWSFQDVYLCIYLYIYYMYDLTINYICGFVKLQILTSLYIIFVYIYIWYAYIYIYHFG